MRLISLFILAIFAALLLCSCGINTNYKAVYIAKDGSALVENHYSKGGAMAPTLKAGKVYIFSHFVK